MFQERRARFCPEGGCFEGGGHSFVRKWDVVRAEGIILAEKGMFRGRRVRFRPRRMLRWRRARFHPKRECCEGGGPGFIQNEGGGHSFIRKGNVARAEGIVLSEKGMFRGRRARFHPKR